MSAKSQTTISQKSSIQSFDRHPESISVTEPVNLASQHQHDASKTITNPSDSETQIHIENNAYEEIEIERFDNGYPEKKFPVEKLVNVARQIHVATQLQDLLNIANQDLHKEAASLQHEMSNSDNPAIRKREIVPKYIDDEENQIHIQNQIRIQDIKDTDDDINRIIGLFVSLVAVIVLLGMFIGGIALRESLKSDPTPCIDEVIGDGVCDDRQNVAECNYDGRDCCIVDTKTKFCEDCRCHLGKCSKQSRRKLFEKLI
jgi:hypothetical protein